MRVSLIRPLLSPLVLLSPQFMLRGIAGLHLQSEFLVTVTVQCPDQRTSRPAHRNN